MRVRVHIKPTLESFQVRNGFLKVNLDTWRDFENLIRADFFDKNDFIFRGQQKAEWTLRSSFDRKFKGSNHISILNNLFERFKINSRGLIKDYTRTILNQSTNEWWALGQHNGLLTPLLDWTESPFIASYFAFLNEEENKFGARAVYALSKKMINKVDKDILEIFNSEIDENKRLIKQKGLFTISHKGIDIEDIIEDAFNGDINNNALVKIEIKETTNDRLDFLKYLDKMDINHLSLFEELYGAAIKSNFEVQR